ncbi:AlpA family transcriptional regulator [Neiella marina]|uniref:AlpA family transcriptional regulator n=1 Tax=Neiella holothuriorum TaxID=2870530 RepID=A0ABS7EGG5_9GAMM|nr:AlpA family transcriptional regulator [Neiella holothuriorum]MBW8191439.1 AlpA family transcriptional regulator [Neiella holothuriorum]
MTTRILSLKDVKSRVSLSRSTIYRRMAAGVFPIAISLGCRRVGWLESEVDTWLKKQITIRDNCR